MKENKISRRMESLEKYFNEFKSSLSTTEWFHIQIILCLRKQSLHFITFSYKLKYNKKLQDDKYTRPILFWHHSTVTFYNHLIPRKSPSEVFVCNHSILGSHPRVWGLSIIPLGEASLTYGLFCGVYTEIANSLCENLSPHDDLRAYK